VEQAEGGLMVEQNQRRRVAAILEPLLAPGLAVWDVDYSAVPLDYLLAVHLSLRDDPMRRPTVGYMPFDLDAEGEVSWCREFAEFASVCLGSGS
jgi:hypothetical protein